MDEPTNLEDTPKRIRLDLRLIHEIPELSRSFGTKLIQNGKVAVNGEVIDKPGYKLWPYDELEVDYDKSILDIIPDIELPIIYEDGDCVAIDKPTGVLTHTKGRLQPEATVATWLRRRIHNMTGDRAGIVHRLDRATSGVMICAKHPAALKLLQKQFENRTAKKTYLAVVSGMVTPDKAIIDLPIERNPKAPATFRVGASGKDAQTRYEVVKFGKDTTLLELHPATGRTHQLRVHLAHISHPILGDPLYGKSDARLYLHSYQLSLTLPNGTKKTFTSQAPTSFEKVLGL